MGDTNLEMNCKICCSPSVKSLGEIEGYRKKTFFEVIECSDCGTKFTLPTESDEKIYEAIYNNVAIVPGYARYLHYARQVLLENDPIQYLMNCEECYWGIANTLLTESGGPQNENLIWEIGSGQGYLTYALVRAGFNAIGLDISESAVTLARSRYGNYFFCEDAKSFFVRTNKRPSFIILSEVIEHLTNPISFISELLDYLQPGGSIIFTTPNKDACLTKELWDTDLPPVHLWWLTKKGLNVLGEKLNCKVAFANMEGFYNENLRFRKNTGEGNSRTPILDNEYRVINTLKQESEMVLLVKKVIKSVIPQSLLRKIKLKKAEFLGLDRSTAETPNTLCAIYTALPGRLLNIGNSN